MQKLLSTLVITGPLLVPHAALAAERTVTFAIENMTCVTCPHIVKQSMAAVSGVARVSVSFTAKTATVTFDDSKATADAIALASTNAGYPAQPAQQAGGLTNSR